MDPYKKFLTLLLISNLFLFQSLPLNAIGTPAGTIISSGGDRGQKNYPDEPGDTILSYHSNIRSTYVTSNIVDVKVSTGYAIAPLKEFKDKIPVRIGITEHIPYSVLNLANANDIFQVSYSFVPKPNWSIGFTMDENQDEIHQPKTEDLTSFSFMVNLDTTFYFFITVTASTNTPIGETFIATMTVKNQNGLGREDNWPPLETVNDTRTTKLEFFTVEPDTIPPSIPVGLEITIPEDKSSLTLSWKSSPETDTRGYYVYRAPSIQELIDIKYYTFVTTNTFTDVYYPNMIMYYKVRSVDRWGNMSEDSMYIDTKDEDIICIYVDKAKNIKAKLIIPKDYNPEIKNLHIIIRKLDNETPNDIGIYKLEIYEDGNLRKPVKNVKFSNLVELRIYYTNADLRDINPEDVKNRLSMFHHNGIEWINICGLVRKDKKYIYTKLTHLSKYKVSLVNLPEKFAIISISPHKIFVPKEDTIFSKIKFTLRYPSGVTPTGKIYDLIGTHIRVLTPVMIQTDNDITVSYFEWDGKDKLGNFVPSGIYIYQFEHKNEVINGTIIVAK